jgi:predicted permease
MIVPDRFERMARAWHRALLAAYPRDFRDDFARDMDETFADRLREARRHGEWSVARLMLGTLLDASWHGVAARAASLPGLRDVLHVRDLRHAFRQLGRSPFFSLLTLVVLAGGMGVSIFTFSFLHTAMLRPLPLSGGDEIVRVQQVQGGRTSGIDAADLAAMRPQVTTLRDLGSWGGRQAVLGGDGARAARRVIDVTTVEWTVFDATRTPPLLGRPFRAGDEAAGAAPVLVLGHALWQRAFGADSGVVGRRVLLDGTPTEVIGVMPPGYGFPVASDSWAPLGAAVRESPPAGRYTLNVYGRLAPGASPRRVEGELQALLARARADRPAAAGRADADRAADSVAATPSITVRTFQMAQMGDEGPVFFTVINLMATLILLLACVNVANLLMARANERARELAVRLALGASHGRLAMQAVWEPLVLVLAGGAMATALAAWGLAIVDGWARANLEGNLAFWWVWGMDRTTLLAAGGFMTVTIAVLGGVMAVRATSARFTDVLRDGGARAGERGAGRVARALVATQVATVTVLMFFGVLSGIAAYELGHVRAGFDTRNLLASTLEPDAERFPTAAARQAYWHRLAESMRGWPEVTDILLRARVGAANAASGNVSFADGRTAGAGTPPRAWVHGVLGTLESLGVPLLEGRSLGDADRAGQPGVALVSRAMAQRHWPGRSPVGERIRLAGLGEGDHAWRTIVGVVGDVDYGEEFSRDRSAVAVYIPLAQHDAAWATLLFRHRGDATAAHAALHASVTAIDPLAAPGRVTTYDEVLEKSGLLASSVTRLFALCFGFALILAMSGTYGLMARAIGLRRRELAVRRALGASDGSIQRLLLGQGGRQLGVGAVVALPLMLAVGVAFSQVVPVATWLAVVTGLGVCASIVLVVMLATLIPTRRALAVAPGEALARDS